MKLLILLPIFSWLLNMCQEVNFLTILFEEVEYVHCFQMSFSSQKMKHGDFSNRLLVESSIVTSTELFIAI